MNEPDAETAKVEWTEYADGRPWQVVNHAFIGMVRVQREVEAESTTHRKLTSQVDDWLPYAVDLRVINEIKQDGFKEEHEGLTDLRHNGTYVGTVNAPFHELLPHFIASRHLFDTTQELIEECKSSDSCK